MISSATAKDLFPNRLNIHRIGRGETSGGFFLGWLADYTGIASAAIGIGLARRKQSPASCTNLAYHSCFFLSVCPAASFPYAVVTALSLGA